MYNLSTVKFDPPSHEKSCEKKMGNLHQYTKLFGLANLLFSVQPVLNVERSKTHPVLATAVRGGCL